MVEGGAILPEIKQLLDLYGVCWFDRVLEKGNIVLVLRVRVSSRTEGGGQRGKQRKRRDNEIRYKDTRLPQRT